MSKLDKESVIGISALLVHAANIDDIYSDHEKDLVRDFIKSYLNDEDPNEVLKEVTSPFVGIFSTYGLIKAITD